MAGINPNSINLLSSANLSTRDIDPLVKLISTRLGVSELTAFTVLRKFMGTANASTFSEIQNFITDFLSEGNNQRQVGELAKDLQAVEKNQNPKSQEQSFKPIIARLQYGLAETRPGQKIQSPIGNDRFVGANQARAVNTNPATDLVQSPKLFASWLVNNKAAFLTLRANPQLANLLLALQNPEITKSPVLLSQMTALIAQLLKLKAGKSLSEDIDEVKKEETDKEYLTDYTDYETNIVNQIKEPAARGRVDSMRDFLLEAERFAEEEIANLWSLTLKKEKELEHKLKSGFSNFKNNAKGRE